jgi:hypothetical protein
MLEAIIQSWRFECGSALSNSFWTEWMTNKCSRNNNGNPHFPLCTQLGKCKAKTIKEPHLRIPIFRSSRLVLTREQFEARRLWYRCLLVDTCTCVCVEHCVCLWLFVIVCVGSIRYCDIKVDPDTVVFTLYD